jgi:hypothetical protein
LSRGKTGSHFSGSCSSARQLLPARQLCPGLIDRGFSFKYLK